MEIFRRSDIVSQLEKRLKGLKDGFRQNVAIMGRAGCGKTTLIKGYLNSLKGADMFCVYAEARPADQILFIERFAWSLLYNYSRLTKGDAHALTSIDEFAEIFKGKIPKTVDGALRVRELARKGRLKEAFDGVFELPAILSVETEKAVVVVLDEFQNLASFNIDGAFSILGRKLMVQKQVMYVLISSDNVEGRKVLNEKLALLFGSFEIMDMDMLDRALSLEFLQWRMPQKYLPTDISEFIASFCCGRALYLDLIASLLNKITAERITEAHLKDALHGLIAHPNGYMNKIFEMRLGPEAPMLVEIASGKNSTKLIKAEIKGALAKGYVKKHGSFLRIPDVPFKVWLRSVYTKRKVDFTLDGSYADEAFASDVSSLLDESRRYGPQDLSKRLAAAVRLFKGERISLNDKEAALPYSSETRIRHITDYETLLLVSGKDKELWAFYLTERPATEAEVEAFVKLTKSLKPAPSKKVFISPIGINTDGAILAKEAKLLLWDRNWVEMIFEFFEKKRRPSSAARPSAMGVPAATRAMAS